jgi:hypothetical protein
MSASGGLFRAQILIDEQLHLYDWWRSLPTDGSAPARAELRPAEIARFLPNVTLYERSGDDWRIRLAGTALFEALGEEVSGKNLGELPLGDGVRTWRRALNFSCDTRGPVCGAQRLWWNGPRQTARFWLRLPFAGPAGYPALIMGHETFRPLEGALRAPAIAWAG